MSLHVAENQREPWSRVTDTRILRPRDELRLVGMGFTAILGVLDSHDPNVGRGLTLGQWLGLEVPPLPYHHHVLVQIEGRPDVLSTGLRVGSGEPEELLLEHLSRRQFGDVVYAERLRRLHTTLESGNHGLYFMSEEETVSASAEGRTYLNEQGGLLI